MTDKNIKRIVISALIAALYATLTIALAPISYLGAQFRISEIMVLLAFYKKDYIVGLTLGCFIANILGPNGTMDVILGTFATFISVWGIYLTGKYIKGKKSIWIASIWPTIFIPRNCRDKTTVRDVLRQAEFITIAYEITNQLKDIHLRVSVIIAKFRFLV